MKVYRKLIRPVHCYPGQGYEPKTELVEKEEKWYPEEEREHLEEKYGYLNEGHFSDLIFEEKYEPYLLKEQKAVEPKTEPSAKGYWFTCGACGWWLFQVCDTVHFDDRKRIHYCASCGRSVKWE